MCSRASFSVIFCFMTVMWGGGCLLLLSRFALFFFFFFSFLFFAYCLFALLFPFFYIYIIICTGLSWGRWRVLFFITIILFFSFFLVGIKYF